VFDQLRVTVIDELLRQSLDDPDLRLDLAQAQHTPIGTDRSTVALPQHRAPPETMKFELFAVTLRHARVPRWPGYNALIAGPLCQIEGPLLNPMVRFPG
jgi:hypothetical protein